MKKSLKLVLLAMISVLVLGNAHVNAQNFKISAPTDTIYVKQKIKLKVKPSMKKGSIIWKSSNRKIATVSKSGAVTGKKAGKVRIYAVSSDDRSEKTSYVIRVKKFKERSLSAKFTVLRSGEGFLSTTGKKYHVFRSRNEIEQYLKSVKKNQNIYLGEMPEKLKKYKKPFFNTKSLCVVYITAGSSSMPVNVEDVKIVQNKKGTVVGSVCAKIVKQPPDVGWACDVVAYYAIVELDKKDADMIQSYKVVKQE